MSERFQLPRLTPVTGAGSPYSGGKLYFYDTGTSTPKDTYSDNALTTPNANPVVADSDGRFGDIFLQASNYKVVLKTSADVTVWTADPVLGTGASAAATETVAGIAKIATQAETNAGTDDTRIVTPLKLATRPSTVDTGFKNKIINGDFNIWQRGTSFAAIANGAYSADRWQYSVTGTAVHTLSRSTDVPTVAQAGRLFNYSLLLDCTTADAAIAAGDNCFLHQNIEGFNFLPIAQRAFTCSFWVKATKTGIYCAAFRNSGADRSYIAEYTINAADTWELKTVNVLASPSAGTWDYTNGIGLDVTFTIVAGSTYHTTAGAWQTGNFLATANQVNGADNAANDFRIAGVQVEAGSAATAWDDRSFETELGMCERYYQKTFQYATAPVQNAGANTGETNTLSYTGGAIANQIIYVPVVRMRANPTVVTFNPAAANAEVRNISGAVDDSATTVSVAVEREVVISFTQNAGSAATHRHGAHLTLAAEL